MESYFSNQELIAQNHLNAIGDSVHGENFYAGGVEAQREEVSLPIILIATNTATTTETNIELFDTVNAVRKANIGLAGDGSKVVLSSGIQNISIVELLSTIAYGQTYKMAGVRITAASASDSSANSAPSASITYSVKDLNGKSQSQPLKPSANVFAQFKNIRDVKFPMLINALASFKVSSMPASTEVTYEFYPEAVSSPSTVATRSDANRGYSPAGLNAVATF